jgi:hypothetical protein
MTQQSNFPLREARGTAARGNRTTVHNASQLAARHNQPLPVAGTTLDTAAGSVCSADLDNSAADIAAHARGKRSI